MRCGIILFLIIQSCILSGQNFTRVQTGKLCDNDGPPDYLYAPSAMYEDGLYKIWACKFAGEGEGDGAYYKEAADIDDFYGQEWDMALNRNNANSAAFDYNHVCDPSVIKSNGMYYMYYGGRNEDEVDSTQKTRIGYATSPDGKTWTRGNYGEPIVDIEPGDSFTEGFYGIGQPAVVELNDEVYMIYTYRINENQFKLRVIKSSTFDFSNYILVADNIHLDGYSVDMAYDQVRGKFVVIVNGLACIHLHYFTENFNSAGRATILAGNLPNFGEGIGLLTTPDKQLLFPHIFGGNGYELPYCFMAATNTGSGSQNEHVQGDMEYEVYASGSGCLDNYDLGDVDYQICNGDLSNFTQNESEFVDKTFYVPFNLDIDYPVVFRNCTFYFNENASLSISSPDGLVDFEGCTLTSSSDCPWFGVSLLGGSNTKFGFGTLIEHSIYGVEASNGAVNASFFFTSLKDNRHAATFKNANHTVNFQDTRIFASDSGFEPFMGQNMFGVIIQNNKNVTRFTECNFDNLHFGISTGNAIIQLLGGNYFTDIGSSEELVVSNSPAIAIKCNNNSFADISYKTTFRNCSQGIAFNNSSGDIRGNEFNVYTNAISITNAPQRTLIDGNTIEATREGINALSSLVEITDNKINILGEGFGDFSAAISVTESKGFIDIISNTINLQNNASGIVLTNINLSDVLENTIITEDNSFIIRSGIALNGGKSNQIGCNYLENSSSKDYHIGLSTNMSHDNQVISNEFRGHLFNYYLSEFSRDQTLIENKFISGVHGMTINSSLGKIHDFKGNEWNEDGITGIDAYTELGLIDIQQMRFEVDGSNYPFFPQVVSSNSTWFENPPGTNSNNDFCSGNPGDDEEVDNIIDQLEELCRNLAENDTLSCEEQWLHNYQLYQLTKINVDSMRLIRLGCLSNFMSDMDSTDIGLFSTIDSLLTTNIDSTLNANIDSSYSNIISNKVFNPRLSMYLDSLLTLRDSIKGENFANIDSLLDTSNDTCQLSDVWLIVYEALYVEMSGDSSRNTVNLKELEFIAELCPIKTGHVVYLARALVSRQTGRYYTDEACDGRVNPRSIESLNNTSTTNNNRLLLMPNPSSEKVYFETKDEKITDIEIYNINGYLISTDHMITKSNGWIDVSDLVKGIYILRCRTDKTEYSERFLVH